MQKGKKFLAISLIVIGVISIIFAFVSTPFNSYYSGSHVDKLVYGGDAYTGIQNAAAETANNVKSLIGTTNAVGALIAETASRFYLLVGALLIIIGIYTLIANKAAKKTTLTAQQPIYAPQSDNPSAQ